MRKVLLAALVCLLLAPSAAAEDSFPLRKGSSGPRVAALQWLLTGARPNVYDKVKGTFPDDVPRGYWGDRTSRAVAAYKYRLGWPAPQWKEPVVTKDFFDVLTGKKLRPKSYVARAASRVRVPEAGATKLALSIKALETSQVGVSETWGNNWGPQIALYQKVTGAYKQAWCVSFQQWGFLHGGYGTFADKSAGVYYVVDWAAHHSYLHAKPKLGAIVAFDAIRRHVGGGHMGFVTRVTAAGFATVEGNASNAVRERFWTWGSRDYVFVYLPGVA